jgi:cytosine/adenosine deaminase-related metal-dependent hydrolase
MSFHKTSIPDNLSVIKADWLLPVTAVPIEECAVIVTDDNTIYDFGSRSNLETLYNFGKMRTVDMSGYILMPALVNAHTHLYYSAFRNKLPPWNDFLGWVEGLLAAKQIIPQEVITAGIFECADLMYRKGISLIGNICSDYFWDADIAAKTSMKGINFLEVTEKNYGSKQFFNDTIKKIETANEISDAHFRSAVAPHSIYSCPPSIIKTISDYNMKKDLPTCIHLAESAEETELVSSGKGRMKDFLSRRGIDLIFNGEKHRSPVQYMGTIGSLNSNLLAIHLVHLDDEDISLLARKKVRIVTCPGSNRFLRAGVAPLEKLLAEGLSISIGTDSAAGNDDLDIFREMRIIREEHHRIPAAKIIEMATINGAKALGWDREYGSIEKGKKTDLIALPLPEERISADEFDVEEYIITKCCGDNVTRLSLLI